MIKKTFKVIEKYSNEIARIDHFLRIFHME